MELISLISFRAALRIEAAKKQRSILSSFHVFHLSMPYNDDIRFSPNSQSRKRNKPLVPPTPFAYVGPFSLALPLLDHLYSLCHHCIHQNLFEVAMYSVVEYRNTAELERLKKSSKEIHVDTDSHLTGVELELIPSGS